MVLFIFFQEIKSKEREFVIQQLKNVLCVIPDISVSKITDVIEVEKINFGKVLKASGDLRTFQSLSKVLVYCFERCILTVKFRLIFDI